MSIEFSTEHPVQDPLDRARNILSKVLKSNTVLNATDALDDVLHFMGITEKFGVVGTIMDSVRANVDGNIYPTILSLEGVEIMKKNIAEHYTTVVNIGATIEDLSSTDMTNYLRYYFQKVYTMYKHDQDVTEKLNKYFYAQLFTGNNSAITKVDAA